MDVPSTASGAFVKGFLDLLTVHFLTDFGRRPQHLLGSLGLFCFLLGGVGIAALSVQWVLSRVIDSFEVLHLHERAIFYYSIVAVLLGDSSWPSGSWPS